MKKIVVPLLLSLNLLMTVLPVSADAITLAHWNLPKNLSDQNTSIRFELDSTWHMVHGKVSGIAGMAKLSDPENPSSVNLELSIPVAKLDTDNSMRDKKMREVMSADTYKKIRFKADGLLENCTPARVLAEGTCKDTLKGELQIRNTRKLVSVPVSIVKQEGDVFAVQGSLPVRWAEYGVEDPSIFIASVDPVVTIFFESTL